MLAAVTKTIRSTVCAVQSRVGMAACAQAPAAAAVDAATTFVSTTTPNHAEPATAAACDPSNAAATAAAAAATPQACSMAGVMALATKAPLVGPGFAQFLSLAPPACFFFMQTSPLKTMKEIIANKSTGKLNPLPFVSLAGNCVIWSLYGYLQSDMTVLLPNATGLAFGCLYTAIFAKYNSGEYNFTPYLGGGLAVAGGAIAAAAMLPAATAATALGLAGCTSAVLLMASPLAVIRTIIKEKNTSAMPFATSFATLLNASSWSAYGLLVAQDYMIFAPNVLGLGAATVQMGLFMKYPSTPQPDADTPAMDDDKTANKRKDGGDKN